MSLISMQTNRINKISLFFNRFFTQPFTLKKAAALSLVAFLAWGGYQLYYRYLRLPAPVIVMINTYPLRPADKIYYKTANPYGFLLGIPIHADLDPRQLRHELEEILGRRDFLFFIDQEGGEVNRLKEFDPSFKAPSAQSFETKAKTDLAAAAQEVYQYGLRTGQKLQQYTIDVVFAPLAEAAPLERVPFRSRYFSTDPHITRVLATAYAKGLADGGVIPCYKHAPGLSAVESDPHTHQQIIAASRQQISQEQLSLFRPGTHWPFMMTAHGYYTAIDPKQISTYSPLFYSFLRQELPYDGLLIPDALNMQAAAGREERQEDILQRIQEALEAGADVVVPFFSINAPPGEMAAQIQSLSVKYAIRLKWKMYQLQKAGRFNVGPANKPPWLQRKTHSS